MVEDGHRTFKLVSANDSELSQKVLVEFGKHFKMELEPEI